MVGRGPVHSPELCFGWGNTNTKVPPECRSCKDGWHEVPVPGWFRARGEEARRGEGKMGYAWAAVGAPRRGKASQSSRCFAEAPPPTSPGSGPLPLSHLPPELPTMSLLVIHCLPH